MKSKFLNGISKMGVVRIDDRLLKRIREHLKKEDNKYKYGSIASFVNSMIHSQLKEAYKNDRA